MRLVTCSLLVVITACDTSKEAPRIQLPVTTTSSPLGAATTDLGYTIELTRLRIAVSSIEFTTEGETHQDVARAVPGVPPPPHPGHSAGGEVTGELPGDHLLEWNGQVNPPLGMGTLIVGEYHGANFTFRAAGDADGLASDDRLLGHTFHLEGTVSRDGTTKPLVAVLDVEPDSVMIGAVFEATLTETSTDVLAIEFAPTDPFEGDTPFDAVDLFALPETDGAIEITPGSTAHNMLRRAIQTHDHYAVVLQAP